MQLNHLELLDRAPQITLGARLEEVPKRRPVPYPPPPEPPTPKDEADPDSVLSQFRWISRLRAASDELGAGQATPVPASDPSVLAYVRDDGDGQVLVVLNLTGSDVTGFTLDLGTGRLSHLDGSGSAVARVRVGGGGAPGALPAVTSLPAHGYLVVRMPAAAA